MLSFKSPRLKFGRRGCFIEKLTRLAGFREECCTHKHGSTRLRLMNLEDRMVPATISPNLSAFDPMGWAGKTVYVKLVPETVGTGNSVVGEINWGDGKTTTVNSWNTSTESSRIYEHVYEDAAEDPYDMQIFGHDSKKRGMDNKVHINPFEPPPLVCIDPTLCEIQAPNEDPVDPWAACANAIDPGFSIPSSGVNVDPGIVPPSAKEPIPNMDPGFSPPPPENCAPGATPFSAGPVRYADGVVRMANSDLYSIGYGMTWAQTRSWSNGPGYDQSGAMGNGWVQTAFPTLVELDDGSVAIVSNGTTARFFDPTVADPDVFVERYFGRNQLSFDGVDEFTLVTQSGLQLKFDDGGLFLELSDNSGNKLEVEYDTGKIDTVSRTNGTIIEEWVYTYNGSLLDTVELRLVEDKTETTIRYVTYDYYGANEDFGNLNDLKSATIFDADDDPLGTQYYRYYKLGDANGYTGGLKMVLGWDSFDRADAALDPLAAGDNDLLPYADLYFEYDDLTRRVTEERVQGAGCSMCAGGVGTYSFSYLKSLLIAPDGYNHWEMRTTETLPDGNQNIVYTNAFGQVMYSIQLNTTTFDAWRTHYVYDGQGRVVQISNPSSTININESDPTLVVTNGVQLGMETEFQVNTYTTGGQLTPTIARNGKGESVIVWRSDGQDGSNFGVYGQRLNAAGQPVGAEFKVNTYTTGNQQLAVPAMDADGDFVVVWASNGQDGSGYGIYGQRYNAEGTPQGSNFQVSQYTTGSQYYPSVAMDLDGNFTVVWQSAGQDGSGYGVYGRRYDAAGSALVGEFLISTYTTGNQHRARIAMDHSGDFTVVWASAQDGSNHGIYGQRFDSTGATVDYEFQINDFTTNDQFVPAIAMDADGDFIVVWNTYSSSFLNSEVWARRYDYTGTAVDSDEFQVNVYTTSFQIAQTVACNAVGDFVVAWSSSGEDGNNYGIFARHYMANKTASDPFKINDFTTGFQSGQTIASDYDGQFMVTWTSAGQDGSDNGIFARPLERVSYYVEDSAGLIVRYVYGRTTTADYDTPGDVAGLIKSTWIVNGEKGTPVKQNAIEYFQFTEAGVTISPVASMTAYVDESASVSITTEYDYDFVSSSLQLYKLTITRPTITTAQNGPDSATTEEYVFNDYRHAIWIKDAGGYLTYREYDDATGRVTLRIDDVDTGGSGFDDLPTGWTKTGGLHLTSEYKYDLLGRGVYSKDPMGHENYVVFNDAKHEYRVYADWNMTTEAPTGPIQVYRHDRAKNYVEMFTSAMSPELTGDLPNGTENFESAEGLLESLTRLHLNNAGQPIRTDAYFKLDDVTYDPDELTLESTGNETRHYESFTDYAFRGWVKRTETPNGTITRYIHDNLGRVTQVWVGTDDVTDITDTYWPEESSGTNMILFAEYEYDGGGVGDSNLTSTTAFPGGGADDRVTEFLYDWRNRVVLVKSGVEGSEGTSVNRPIAYTVYDNLNRLVETRTYDGDNIDFLVIADVLDDLDTGDFLRSKNVSDYDNFGRVFQTHVYEINPTDGSEGRELVSNVWYDARGFVIRSASPGGLVQKTKYNGMGWVTDSYVTDGRDGSADYVEEYGDWDDVVADTVYHSTHYAYDDNGMVISATTKQRFHDETGYGELGDSDSTPYARVSYSASWYDADSNRVTATANYGTYGGNSWSRPGTAPGSSNTILQVDYDYDAAGRLFSVTDPRGIESRSYFDALGRTSKTIQNFTGIGEIDDDFTDENKTTEFVYDGSGHLTHYKAWLNEITVEVTEYIYGVTVAGGNLINSNELLSMVIYPDVVCGPQPAQFTYEYNQLGQRITMEDVNGTAHAYTFDIVGRPVQDEVTAFGSGIDETVVKLQTAYDSAGRAYLFTSLGDEDLVLNQVAREFNGFGQVLTEYQQVDGVVTGGSPKVEYGYSDTGNFSRLETMKYPTGEVLTLTYDQVGRLLATQHEDLPAEGYEYLGLGTVIERTRDGVLRMSLWDGGVGEAGDQYFGLDRFGRVIDLLWEQDDGDDLVHHSSFLETESVFTVGYDRNGNRLWRTDELDHNYDELYHKPQESDDVERYDGLNQLKEFARGELSDYNSDGMLDDVASPTREQSWTIDGLGNFDSVTDDKTKVNRVHDEQNRLLQVGASTLTFDAAGNMTTDETGRDFTYDAWNRIVKVNDSAHYSYDALNRRNIEGGHELYYSTGWQLLEERFESTAYQYVWSPVFVDALAARLDYVDSSLVRTTYALNDVNWNIVALTDGFGDLQARVMYDPYGKFTLYDMAPVFEEYQLVQPWVYFHQGSRFDFVVDLFAFRNRDYSPTIMRWSQMDPIGFNGLDSNLFRSNGNSPMMNSDPSGTWSWSGFFGGLIGTAGTIMSLVTAPAWVWVIVPSLGIAIIAGYVDLDFRGGFGLGVFAGNVVSPVVPSRPLPQVPLKPPPVKPSKPVEQPPTPPAQPSTPPVQPKPPVPAELPPVTPGVGAPVVVPPHANEFGNRPLAGSWPAVMKDGVVYVHHMHALATQAACGGKLGPTDRSGFVRLDGDGNVISAQWDSGGPK